MEKFIDGNFKDDSPLSTVEKIRNILKSNGIEVEEQWIETQVPYCFALLLKIKGLNFSTSGKGLSREFALASAYGEMIERVQLGFLGNRATQKDGSYSANDSQDILVPLKKLLDDGMDMYEKVSERLLQWYGEEFPAQDILLQYANEQGEVSSTPFYDLTREKMVYLPSGMRKSMYASNGCAAGNTLEEAIVQALSEVVERFHRLRIIQENICVPQIPDEVLEKYEVPYKIIKYVREQGYKVWVKDCSLGKKFPVVCVCYVNKKTGKYHTHFGAYPIFEIALTRALTETFQGPNIESFTKYSDFFYNKTETEFIYNLAQELTYGTAKRFPEFFVGPIKYEYNSQMGFSGENNFELLKECIGFLREQGYNVLVRNSSSLGFPTVQVIVPGYSETFLHRLSKGKDDNRYLSHAVKTLRNPAMATIEEMLGLLCHIEEVEKLPAHTGKTGFLANSKMMAEISKAQDKFYLLATVAYVNYTFGKYSAACKYVNNMINLDVEFKKEFLVCIKRYLDLKARGYQDEQIEELLRVFHNEDTVKKFYGYIEEDKNPFEEFVLHCDMKCDDSCILKQECRQKRVQEIIDLINRKNKELDMDEFCLKIEKIIS